MNDSSATAIEQADTVTADELDKEYLDQLHAATLKASDSCFELKKLCATALVPTGSLVALVSDRRLSEAVFVAGLFVIVSFWIADAIGYYYQRRLRAGMSEIWARRASRCKDDWNPPHDTAASVWRSAFNESMIFYLLLATPVILGLLLFMFGSIQSPQMASS